jgi:hypothetical protein
MAMKKGKKTEAKAEVEQAKFEVEEQVQQQAIPGLPAGEPPPEAGQPLVPPAPPQPESGKAALPLWEDEDDEAKEDESEVILTEQDEEDFWRLDAKADEGLRESFTALREIRRRKLFRAIKDDEGRPKYKSFQRYVEEHKGHTRQWVTQGTNWLRAMEALDHLGITVPLTPDAAQGLLPGRINAAGGYLAVFAEAKEDGVPLTKDNLREIVLRRAEYAYRSKPDSHRKPAASDYEQYKQDLAIAGRLGGNSGGVVSDAKQLPGDVVENIIEVAREKLALPRADDLVEVATGPPLEALVNRLATEVGEVKAKMDLLATRKKQVRAMLQEGGLKEIREEVKALERELIGKGVLTKRAKGKPEPLPPAEGESGRRKAEELAASEVRMACLNAIENLDAAFDGDWPEDPTELEAILKVAEDAEEKVTEVIGKAKELLADASLESETIAGGA